jgi:hypothetical protein
VTALKRLRDNPASYGFDEQSVYDLLQQEIAVQHRWYGSHQEAMRDFQLINNGTKLTPDDLCRGFLRYMDRYDDFWHALLEEALAAVRRSTDRLEAGPTDAALQRDDISTKKRETVQKHVRHTWALLHRYIVKEKSHTRVYADVASSNIAAHIETDGDIVEKKLVSALQSLKDDATARAEIKGFVNHIDSETAHLDKWVIETAGPVKLSPTLHRWLLELSIWRRNNKVPHSKYEAFVRRLLEDSQGKSQWKRDQNKGSVGLGGLVHLPNLAASYGMGDLVAPTRRTKPNVQLRTGWEHSHEKDFKTHGNGPTFPELRGPNRERGAKPVSDHDVDDDGLPEAA